MPSIRRTFTFDDVLIQPNYSNIDSREEVNIQQDFLWIKDRIPIISANMDMITGPKMVRAMYDCGGVGILHRFYPWEEQLNDMWRLWIDGYPIIFSVGARDTQNSVERVLEVAKFAKVFAVCVDVAHGYHSKVIDLVGMIQALEIEDLYVIVGNVATYDATLAFMNKTYKPVSALKVGIGPGSVCTTRTVTGVGVPQLTAIADCAEAIDFQKSPPLLIADGGIKSSGDIVKALTVGADFVMLGHLLAGTAETPGSTIFSQDGRRKYKVYRGQSILGVNGERYVKEGISGFVEESGPVADVIKQLVGGIKSGLSYVGARNLLELRTRAKFIEVSTNTMHENSTRVSEVM